MCLWVCTSVAHLSMHDYGMWQDLMVEYNMGPEASFALTRPYTFPNGCATPPTEPLLPALAFPLAFVASCLSVGTVCNTCFHYFR